MKKRKIILIAIGVLCLILLFVAVSMQSCKQADSSKVKDNLIDTLVVKNYCDKAKLLKNSHSDSAAYWYDKALQQFDNKSCTNSQRRVIADICLDLASIYANTGKDSLALVNDSIAMSIGIAISDNEIIARANLNLGLLQFNVGEYNSALIHYRKVDSLSRSINNKKLLAKAITNIAIVNYLKGSVSEAIIGFKNTLDVAKELNDNELIAGAYINMGLVYDNSGDYNNAIESYNQALTVYKKDNAKDGIVLCYQNIGSVYFLTCNFEKAIENFNMSLRYALEFGDKINTAKAYHNLGEVYAQLGDYKLAAFEYLKSAKIKEQLNNKQSLSADFTSLGSLSVEQQEYTKALSYFNKALDINLSLDYKLGIAKSYSNIANVYCLQKKYDKALELNQKSLLINESVGNKAGVVDDYYNLGNLMRKKKNFKQSFSFFMKALKIKRELNDTEGCALVYSELASLYVDLSENEVEAKKHELLNKAIEYGLKSSTIAVKLKTLKIESDAYLILKQAYTKDGNASEALKYANKYIVVNDSLFSKSKTEAITNAEARWNSEKKQRIIENLENQHKLQQEVLNTKTAEAKKQQFVIYAIVIVLIMMSIIFIITVVYIRSRREISYQLQLQSIAKLRMQNARNRVSPHFLFNMLSNISASANKPDLVKNKIDKLSHLLRKTLENIESLAITLDEELNMVKSYLEFQEEKIPEPFCVNYNIASEVDKQLLIPAMLIQIPVENAIKHGLMPLGENNKVLTINVFRANDNHTISIIDNGIGLHASSGRSTGTGTGLKVLLQTIHLLNAKNKNQILFSINPYLESDGTETGTIVQIVIPHGFNYLM